jgi:hypothetical protein
MIAPEAKTTAPLLELGHASAMRWRGRFIPSGSTDQTRRASSRRKADSGVWSVTGALDDLVSDLAQLDVLVL